jgi:hypothetical protein
VVLDLGDAVTKQAVLAGYMGDHEGCRVEDARREIGVRKL